MTVRRVWIWWYAANVFLAGTSAATYVTQTSTGTVAGDAALAISSGGVSTGGLGVDLRDGVSNAVSQNRVKSIAASASSSDPGFGPPPPAGNPPPVAPPPTGIPAQCLGRQVLYRDWDCAAQGDGTYFAGQGPGRLGFTVTAGVAQIIRFRTPTAADANAYGQYHGVPSGRISVATDGGPWNTMFLSKNPCDLAGALAMPTPGSSAWAVSGGATGGSIYYVALSPADYQAKLASDPSYKWTLRLDPGEYYYLTSLNANMTDLLSQDLKSVANSNPPDTCADLLAWNGAGGDHCYYLSVTGGSPPNTIDSGGVVTCHDWEGGSRVTYTPPPPKHYSAPQSHGVQFVAYAVALLGLGSAYPTGHECSGGDYTYYANPERQPSGQYVFYSGLTSPPECAGSVCFKAEQYVQRCE